MINWEVCAASILCFLMTWAFTNAFIELHAPSIFKYVLRRTLYLHVLMVKLVVNNSDAFNTCTITTACLEKPDPTTFWNNYIKTDRLSVMFGTDDRCSLSYWLCVKKLDTDWESPARFPWKQLRRLNALVQQWNCCVPVWLSVTGTNSPRGLI